jgi:hypothetical protein
VFKQVHKLLLFLALLWALAPPSTQAQVVNCPNGFNTTSGSPCEVSTSTGAAPFWYGPNAEGSFSNGVVTLLKSSANHMAASLLYQTKVNVQAFTASFSFVPDGQNVVFSLNNSTNNPWGFNNNIFSAGAGCEGAFFQGYSQTDPPNDVFALDFDSYDNLTPNTSSNSQFTYSSVQIYQSNLPSYAYPNVYVQCPCIGGSNICGTNTSPNDGDYQIAKLSTSPVPLNSPANIFNTSTGDTYQANITYDGSNFTVTLQDVTLKGPVFTHTWTGVDIPQSVGGNSAFVGIVGSIGSLVSGLPLKVSAFSYSEGAPTSTPTPSSKPTPTVTATSTATVTATVTPTAVPTPTPTPGNKPPHKKWHPWPA